MWSDPLYKLGMIKQIIDKDSLIPRYAQLKYILMEWIHGKYRVGDKIPSERELMQKFGISRITVVRAIKELEYEGLLYSDHGRGTFVTVKVGTSVAGVGLSSVALRAKGDDPGPTSAELASVGRPASARPATVIHIIIPLSIILEDKDRDVFVHKSEYLGIKRACEKEGMHCSIHDAVGPGNGAHLINELRDGVVIFVGNWGKITQKMVPKLRSRGIPWCGIGGDLEQVFPENCIYADLRQGAELVLKHLVRSGYKSIGYCYEKGAKSDIRLLTFKEFIARRLIKNYELFPINYTMKLSSEQIKLRAYRAARVRIKQAKLPQAYFCQNDLLALGILQAAQEKEIKVPEDLAIVGFDDRPEARESEPALTTVRVPFEELGAEAVRQVKRCLENGRTSFSSVKFTCKFIRRDSCRGE
jgi:LacI family transcriptional regulator